MSDTPKTFGGPDLEAMAAQALKRVSSEEAHAAAPQTSQPIPTQIAPVAEQPAQDTAVRAQEPERLPDTDYVAVPRPLSPEEMAQVDQSAIPNVTKMHWPVSTPMEEPSAPPQQPQQVQQPVQTMQQAVSQNADALKASEIGEALRSEGGGLGDDEEVVVGNAAEAAASGTEIAFREETVVLGEDAVNAVKDLPEEARAKFFSNVIPNIKEYQKELITKHGFTPEEAFQAARSRATKLATDEHDQFMKENPNGVIITIDKSQEDKVQFSDEELGKMQRARALKLTVVESEALEHIKVLDIGDEFKMTNIRNISGSLSNYSVPLLAYGDYATFHGAHSGYLARCVVSEDDDLIDAINKKAELLYDQFAGGTILSKYDKDGKPITYNEFCNTFLYEDMDLAVYAVVTASAMENTDSTYICPRCERMYQIRYNQKTLLDLSAIPDIFKKRVAAIDENRSNLEEMMKIHEEAILSDRVKSPLTKNIYQISSSTIAQARRVLSACGNRITSRGAASDVVLLVYLSHIWVYDAEKDGYIPIDVQKDPLQAFETITKIHNVDVELLLKWIQQTRYAPNFKLKTKCPICGREATDNLTVDEMLFLFARGTSTEIK